MKRIFFSFLACGMFANAFAQPEVSEKWVITPVPTMKGVLGRLDINFPPDVERNILIYQQADKKFLKSVSHNDKIYNIAPGVYRFTLTNVPIENVPIQKGHETRLKAGFLDIVSEGDWHLYDETKTKAYTSGNKPKKLPLPVGSYQVKLGGQLYPVIIKDGETVEDYSPVGSKGEISEVQINPEILVDDQYQYIMAPVTINSDSALATKGRINLNFDYPISMGDAFEFFVFIYNTANNSKVYDCGADDPCHGYYYLPEGRYRFLVGWHDDYGAVTNHQAVIIENVPVRKGHETRVKTGYISYITKGNFTLFNDTKEIKYFEFNSQSDTRRLLPVGKYLVSQEGIGDFHVEISDGKTYSLNTIPPGESKYEKYRFINGKNIKLNFGRLDCKFSLADSVQFSIYIPETNGEKKLVSLTGLNFIDLLPGNYEVIMTGMNFQIRIEKGKQTQIIAGYFHNSGDRDIVVCRGTDIQDCSFIRAGKTMPLPAGYYYYKENNGYYLFRVKEGEVK